MTGRLGKGKVVSRLRCKIDRFYTVVCRQPSLPSITRSCPYTIIIDKVYFTPFILTPPSSCIKIACSTRACRYLMVPPRLNMYNSRVIRIVITVLNGKPLTLNVIRESWEMWFDSANQGHFFARGEMFSSPIPLSCLTASHSSFRQDIYFTEYGLMKKHCPFKQMLWLVCLFHHF